MNNVFHCVNSILYTVTNIHLTARILLKSLMFSVVKTQPYSRYLGFKKYKTAESPVTEGNINFEDV